MKTVAIIPAGGAGTRMGGDIPKQYLMLGGVPIIVRTLSVFQEAQLVDDIYLVLPYEDVVQAQQNILCKYNLSKVVKILPGGTQRQDSVKKGLDALGSDYDVVVIHDGVRPFVSAKVINTVIKEATLIKAVTIGIPVKDTLKRLDDQGFIVETVTRDQIWLTQTPQAFSAPLLKKAYDLAYEGDYYGTDDAALVEKMGLKVKMLMGSYDNIKITTTIDLEWGERILKMRQSNNLY